MNDRVKKISIITVCYNSEETIKETLESINNQTYGNVEHIIVDGNSTDATKDILADYKSQIDILISEKDDGIYNAMNKGIKLATGDVIGILNSDDWYSNDLVAEKVVQQFMTAKTDIIYGDLQYVNDKCKVIRNWKAGKLEMKKFKRGWMPPHPTFFVRKKIYEGYGLFNEDFKISADYELILRFLCKHHVKASYLPETLVKMRMGGVSNSSWKNRLRALKEDYKAWKINGLKPKPYTIPLKKISKLRQFF